MTFDAFYDLLIEEEPDAAFIPGNYSLRAEMSARAAFDALQDPENKVTSSLLITEGEVLPNALEIICVDHGHPARGGDRGGGRSDRVRTARDRGEPRGLAVPGDLPARRRRDRAADHPDARRRDDRAARCARRRAREPAHRADDGRPHPARGRVEPRRLLQGVAGVPQPARPGHGTSSPTRPSPTAPATCTPSGPPTRSARTPSNPYNTYANPGPPIGPIGLPGELAIQAAMSPADGPWFFFVPINLATGETKFSETAEEHEAAVDAAARHGARRAPRTPRTVSSDAGRTRLAVLGSPIAHSKSPAIQAAAYRVLGLDWSYTAADVTEDALAGFIADRDDSWRGLSLTMPLKRAVLPLLATPSPARRRRGRREHRAVRRRRRCTGTTPTCTA